MLVQPFIENAIWHGLLLKEGRKRLNIWVRSPGQDYEVLVDDNGIGRAMAGKFDNPELRRKSFGMDITSERLDLFEKVHGLRISYKVDDKTEQGQPAGTTVIIRIENQRK